MPCKVKSFSTIRLSVTDVQKSRDWYKSFFAINPSEDLENFVSFRIGETCLDITVADEKSPVSAGGSVGYWLVDDLDAAIALALSLGAKIYRGPLNVAEIKRTIVQIMDPYGGVFGLEGKF